MAASGDASVLPALGVDPGKRQQELEHEHEEQKHRDPKSTGEKSSTGRFANDNNDRSSSTSPSPDTKETRNDPSSPPRPDGKRELREDECYDILAYSWPAWKKYGFLSVIAGIQISMNFNTSVFPNAVKPLAAHFGVSEQAARVGQMVYLVLYSFGCELWAPWSEEFGRWPILQLSMFLINVWQVPAGLAPNFGTLIVARGLGGLSTAGGSVTLGLIADLYEPEDQQWPLAFIVLSSCIGTSIGGIIGGPIEYYLSWRWFAWIQLIFGGVVQLVHFWMPECRSTILIDREAKRRRDTGEDPNVYGPNELKTPRISLKEAGKIWLRPFEMFVREPIVLCLSLLSGFSDALIFTFLEGFVPVYKQWGFGTLSTAWAFIPINAAYFIAYFSYFPWFRRDDAVRAQKGDKAFLPERRLKWLLWLAPLEPIGLFGFAWTSLGPPIHWIAPMIFSALIGIANWAIYFSSVDYMIAAYGVYSASATGGNAFARDFLAGISAMYAIPMYENIGDKYAVNYASTILACLSCLVVVPIYIFYWKGPQIREASKFAQTLAADREATGGRRVSKANNLPYPEI
ncbi:major facilitator superfamily domain-containing protein [Xylariaceae sp. FL0016]|nr:major facilitator superfamily domain-containing protein [Xylariaceae sp. FL0016]